MTETFHVVKQNANGYYLLSKPNKVIFSSKNRKEAEVAFANITKGKQVYPYEFDKGVYVLLSTGHYTYHPKALYVIDSNAYPI